MLNPEAMSLLMKMLFAWALRMVCGRLSSCHPK